MDKTNVRIEKQKQSNGPTKYLIRWIDLESGDRKSKTIGTDRTAAILAAGEKQKQQQKDLEKPPFTLWQNFIEDDLESVELSLSRGSYELIEKAGRFFGQICKPTFLAGIDVGMIEKFRNYRIRQGVRPATVNIDLTNLRAMLNRARRRGLLDHSPFDGNYKALFLSEPTPEPITLTRNEFDQLLTAAPTKQWRGIILVGYFAGLRVGEILALEHIDVNLDLGMLYVSNKQGHRTKSKQNRSVPLNTRLKEYFEATVGDSRSRQLVFDSTSLKPGKKFERRIKGVSSYFAEICRRAGLIDHTGKHRFTAHDLRRSCITGWLRSGMDIKSVQQLAGHESPLTTLKYYAAVSSERLIEGVKHRDVVEKSHIAIDA